jgi:Fic family protein
MKNYIPPFDVTNETFELIYEILVKMAKLENYSGIIKMPNLRKSNRIDAIHSSLAIEANTLFYYEIENIVNGKMVDDNSKDIQEVKNAYEAYQKLDTINPFSLKEFKSIHKIMTNGILENAGIFRNTGEGVFSLNKCIFMAPPPEMVNSLMKQLFYYLNKNKNNIHPLVLSSIFHYELVFIHPFSDGNGRMARLWQNSILKEWNDIYEYLPIETEIKESQNEYYEVIDICNKEGESTKFIVFMLKMISRALSKLLIKTDRELKINNENVEKLLNVLGDEVLSTKDIMTRLKLNSVANFYKNYLNPALELKLILKTEPNKKTSKKQKYYKV